MLSLIQTVAGRPWAIQAEIAAHVRGLVAREGIAGLRHLAEIKTAAHAHDRRRPSAYQDDDDDYDMVPTSFMVERVGVVTVIGLMTQRGGVVNSAYTRSTAELAAQVRAHASNGRVDAILLEIDSPGGEVYGVPEAWEAIHAAAQLKPVVGIGNSLMASAALYVGSACTELWSAPSGEAGSLGVYTMHVDESRAIEAEGLHVEFIVADESPFKVEGNPFAPLTEDARGEMQRCVNRYMRMFVQHVFQGRKPSGRVPSQVHVLKNFGKGRMLDPQAALEAGMIDKVGTLEQALARASQLGAQWRRDKRGAFGPAALEPTAEPVVMEAPAPPAPPTWSCGSCQPPCASAEDHEKATAAPTPATSADARRVEEIEALEELGGL